MGTDLEQLNLSSVEAGTRAVEEAISRGEARLVLGDSSNGNMALGGAEAAGHLPITPKPSSNLERRICGNISADVKSSGAGPGEGQGRESAALEAAGGMHKALANPETWQALASASAALREVRSKASGLTSDDQASVFDKVIHQQRMQLEQLRLEKAAFEQERAEFRSKVSASVAPLAPGGHASDGPTVAGGLDAPGGLISRVGTGMGGRVVSLLPELHQQVRELDVEKMVKKIRHPKRAAALCCIVLFCLALFVRTQRQMDQVGTMDAMQFDLQIEHSQMEKLVSDLMKDKALLAKERRGAKGIASSGGSNLNGTQTDKDAKRKRAMERHLVTVQRLLEGMHRRHLEAQHGNQLKLAQENEKLAQELKALRSQLSQRYQRNHNISSASASSARAVPLQGLKAEKR